MAVLPVGKPDVTCELRKKRQGSAVLYEYIKNQSSSQSPCGTWHFSPIRWTSLQCWLTPEGNRECSICCSKVLCNCRRRENTELTQEFVDWCQQNCLQMNSWETKELAMVFRRCRHSHPTPVDIQGMAIEMVESFQHLGVHINNKLDWTDKTNPLHRKERADCICCLLECRGHSWRQKGQNVLNFNSLNTYQLIVTWLVLPCLKTCLSAAEWHQAHFILRDI